MRSIATVGDIYGPDSGSTFYNQNNGSIAGPAGTTIGAGPDQSGAGATSAIKPVAFLSGIDGTIFGNPIFQFFVIVIVGIGIYALAKKHVPSVESEFGTPRISVPSFLSTGFMAFVFFILVKSALKKVNIPGLSGLAALA